MIESYLKWKNEIFFFLFFKLPFEQIGNSLRLPIEVKDNTSPGKPQYNSCFFVFCFYQAFLESHE